MTQFRNLGASGSASRLRAVSNLLAEHDPMPVRGANAELAHPPRFVGECLGERRAVRHELAVELVNAFDRDVHEVGMVAQLLGGNSVRAFAEHQSERSA